MPNRATTKGRAEVRRILPAESKPRVSATEIKKARKVFVDEAAQVTVRNGIVEFVLVEHQRELTDSGEVELVAHVVQVLQMPLAATVEGHARLEQAKEQAGVPDVRVLPGPELLS